MTTPTLARILVVILALATFCAQRSLACSCGRFPGDPGNCHDLKATGPSFVGTVIDIQNPPDERRGSTDQGGLSRYRFRVDENISGFEEKEVDIYSGRGGGDCSYHFRMGQSYFVTPYKAKLKDFNGAEPGQFVAEICTETQPAASASALLAELRARKRGSTVEGVLRTKQQPDDYDHGMPNITVELRGKDNTLSTITDSDGVYRFFGIPPGEYQFAVKLPSDFPRLENAPGDAPPSITITDQACYAKNINALKVARVAP
jgi:SdrD B-like domain